MATPLKNPTLEDQFYAVPEHLIAEIIHGALHTQPRPALRHARAATVLGGVLGGPFDFGTDGPGGWLLFDEPEIHLGDNIVVPDLAGWRRERMPAVPPTAYFSLAPDWVCEVISPGTEALDRTKKMPLYALYGVRHLWLLDPVVRTLEVFRLEHERWTQIAIFSNHAIARAEPFESIELHLDQLWGGQ